MQLIHPTSPDQLTSSQSLSIRQGQSSFAKVLNAQLYPFFFSVILPTHCLRAAPRKSAHALERHSCQFCNSLSMREVD